MFSEEITTAALFCTAAKNVIFNVSIYHMLLVETLQCCFIQINFTFDLRKSSVFVKRLHSQLKETHTQLYCVTLCLVIFLNIIRAIFGTNSSVPKSSWLPSSITALSVLKLIFNKVTLNGPISLLICLTVYILISVKVLKDDNRVDYKEAFIITIKRHNVSYEYLWHIATNDSENTPKDGWYW